MALSDRTQAELQELVTSAPVVLFMKGERHAPQCGFSATVVGILDGYLSSYKTVDVLADSELRANMKLFADWATFPQLWVDGELVGGADIVEQLKRQGELGDILGAEPQRVSFEITPAAAAQLAPLAATAPLRLTIDAKFQYEFEYARTPKDDDVLVTIAGIPLVLDPTSARRAQGMKMDFTDGPEGSGMVVDNPNEPTRVHQMSVEEYKELVDEGIKLALIDVRTQGEWDTARIEGARLLDAEVEHWLNQQDKNTPIVFMCHHGMRSQAVAEHFVSIGFKRVFNLSGGIDAWSMRVDPGVPRY